MKNKGVIIFLIFILSIGVVLLVCLLVFMLKGSNKVKFGFFYNNEVSTNLLLDKEYDNKYSKINITSSASDIEIINTDDDKIRLVIYGDEDNYNIREDNDNLDIKIQRDFYRGLFFNLKKDIYKIELYLPKDYDKDLIIENSYGDVKIGNYENMNIDATLDCGDIFIDKIKSGKITNKYGDIKVDGYADALAIDEDCGDVLVSEVDRIKINNSYGDIKIKKVNKYLEVKDDCGDIEINELNIIENSLIENNLGNINVDKTNDIYIEYKTSLGDATVNKSNKDSDVILRINNSCGDIEVNN